MARAASAAPTLFALVRVEERDHPDEETRAATLLHGLEGTPQRVVPARPFEEPTEERAHVEARPSRQDGQFSAHEDLLADAPRLGCERPGAPGLARVPRVHEVVRDARPKRSRTASRFPRRTRDRRRTRPPRRSRPRDVRPPPRRARTSPSPSLPRSRARPSGAPRSRRPPGDAFGKDRPDATARKDERDFAVAIGPERPHARRRRAAPRPPAPDGRSGFGARRRSAPDAARRGREMPRRSTSGSRGAAPSGRPRRGCGRPRRGRSRPAPRCRP